jgi:hypothetical protein
MHHQQFHVWILSGKVHVLHEPAADAGEIGLQKFRVAGLAEAFPGFLHGSTGMILKKSPDDEQFRGVGGDVLQPFNFLFRECWRVRMKPHGRDASQCHAMRVQMQVQRALSENFRGFFRSAVSRYKPLVSRAARFMRLGGVVRDRRSTRRGLLTGQQGR